MVTGDEAALVTLINRRGAFGRDQQEAVWNITDGYDISGNSRGRRPGGQAAPGGRHRSPGAAVDDDPENRLLGLRQQPGAPGGLRRSRPRTGCAASPSATTSPRAASTARWCTCPSRLLRGACRTPTRSAWRWGRPFPDQCGLAGEMPGCVTRARRLLRRGAQPHREPARPGLRRQLPGQCRRYRLRCAPSWRPAWST